MSTENGYVMASLEWVLELVLIALLLATMFHALRLERALGVLKRDRAALEGLVQGFNASTQAAEQGIERLKQAADGAGRHIARQVAAAATLKDDLTFLSGRGETLADRLEQLVRDGRDVAPPPRLRAVETAPTLPGRVVAGDDRIRWRDDAPTPPHADLALMDDDPGPRVRSQAERDLIRALRIAR